MKKKNIIEIIGLSFKLWWKNLVVVLPFVFNFVASIVALILLILLFSFLFSKFSLENILNVRTETEFAELVDKLSPVLSNPSSIFVLVVFLLISVILFLLIKAHFNSGAIAMSYEIVNGKKTNLRTMTLAGKKFMFRYFAVQVIIDVAMFIWIFVFSLPLILTKNISYAILILVSLIPMILIYLLFLLTEYYLIIEDLSVWQAFKKSFRVVKKNYLTALGFGVLLFLINLVAGILGIIPFLGIIIPILVVFPFQTIAFVIFAIERNI